MTDIVPNGRTASAEMPSAQSVNSVASRRIAGIAIAWWVVGASGLGLALGYSAFATAIFGQLTLPLSSEFSWSLAATTGAHSIATVIIVFAAPLVGYLSDRFGVWRVLVFSLAALPLAVAHIATVNGNLLHFYFAVGLVALLGSGTLPVTYTKVLVTWFQRRRGLALGVCLAGVGLGMSVVPGTVQFLTQRFGWRLAIVLMAVAMAVVMLPVGWLLLRQTPSSADEIDGGSTPATERSSDRISTAHAPSLRDSYGSRAFMLLSAAFIILGAANLGIIVNLMPLLRAEGLESETAAWMIGVFGLSFAVTRIVAGWFLDRFRPTVVAFVITICPAVGALLLWFGSDMPNAVLALILIAVGIGGEFDVMSFFVARYFPAALYGRLYSTIYSLYNCGAVVGPVSIAYYHDTHGSFSGALLALCVGMALAAIAFLRLSPPRPRAIPLGIQEETL